MIGAAYDLPATMARAFAPPSEGPTTPRQAGWVPVFVDDSMAEVLGDFFDLTPVGRVWASGATPVGVVCVERRKGAAVHAEEWMYTLEGAAQAPQATSGTPPLAAPTRTVYPTPAANLRRSRCGPSAPLPPPPSPARPPPWRSSPPSWRRCPRRR